MPFRLSSRCIWFFFWSLSDIARASQDSFSLYLAEPIPGYPIGTKVSAQSVTHVESTFQTFEVFLDSIVDTGHGHGSRFFTDDEGLLHLITGSLSSPAYARTVVVANDDVSANSVLPILFATSSSLNLTSDSTFDAQKFYVRSDGQLNPITNGHSHSPKIYACQRDATHTSQLVAALRSIDSKACTEVSLTTIPVVKHYLRADTLHDSKHSASYANTSVPNDSSYSRVTNTSHIETRLTATDIPSDIPTMTTVIVIISVCYQVDINKHTGIAASVLESVSSTISVALGATIIVSTSTLRIATTLDQTNTRSTIFFSLGDENPGHYTGLPMLTVLSPVSAIPQPYSLTGPAGDGQSVQSKDITLFHAISTAITQTLSYLCESRYLTQVITSDYVATFTTVAAIAVMSNTGGLAVSVIENPQKETPVVSATDVVTQSIESSSDKKSFTVLPTPSAPTHLPSRTSMLALSSQKSNNYGNVSLSTQSQTLESDLGSSSSRSVYSVMSNLSSDDHSHTTGTIEKLSSITTTPHTLSGVIASVPPFTSLLTSSPLADTTFSTRNDKSMLYSIPSGASQMTMAPWTTSLITTKSMRASDYNASAISSTTNTIIGLSSAKTTNNNIASATSSGSVATSTKDLYELKSIMVRTYYNQIQRWNAYGCAVSPQLFMQCTDAAPAGIPSVDVYNHGGPLMLYSKFPNGSYTEVPAAFNGIDSSIWNTVSDDFASGAINILFTSCLTNATCTEAYQAAGGDAPRAVEEVVMRNVNYTRDKLAASPDGTWVPNAGQSSFVSRWQSYPSNYSEVYGVHEILQNSLENGIFDTTTVNLILDARYATGYGVPIVEVIYNTLILGQYINDGFYGVEKRDILPTTIEQEVVQDLRSPSENDRLAKERLLQETAFWSGTERAKIWDVLAMDPSLHANLSSKVHHHRRAECAGITASENALKFFESTEGLCQEVEVVESIFSAFGLGMNIGTALSVPRPTQITNLLKGIDEAMLDGIAKICASNKATITCPGGNDAWVLANDLYGGVNAVTEILELAEELVELDSPLVLADLTLKGLSLFCKFADAGKIAYTAGRDACATDCTSNACRLAGAYCADYAGPGP